MLKIYCGVGARSTPLNIINDMHLLADFAAKQGWILRSGGANGADSAFEYGCDLENGKKEIYLPWKGFNGNTSSLVSPSDTAFDTASTIHPAFKTLTPVAKLLLARNMHQILGKDLNTPVRCVICWTPNGQLNKKQYTRQSGGTGSAIALASDWNIPVFNLFHSTHFDMALEFLLNPNERETIQL